MKRAAKEDEWVHRTRGGQRLENEGHRGPRTGRPMPRVPARASGYSSSPNHCPGQVEAGEEEQTHSRKGGKERNNMDGERKRERVKDRDGQGE